MKIKSKTGLYTILLQRLAEVQKQCKKEIIPFPHLFGKICRNFSISKKQGWEVLFLLRDVGLIEIVPFHGVKILTQE